MSTGTIPDPGALWEELVSRALLGTERQAAPLPQPEGALGSLLAQVDAAEPVRALLANAAVVSVYHAAGRHPARQTSSFPDACPLDDLPACSARSAQHLAEMLHGGRAEVLPEWLSLVAAAGKRAPAELLPDLLDADRRQAELRPSILRVLGARGRWLAARNPDWAYVGGEEEEDASWETGSRATRLAILSRLRAADPAQARDLVASTWAEDKPEDRAAFLAVFGQGLSADDEPFLEKALDDRRKEVRLAAAELLSRLPGSALVRRMLERVRPRVRLAQGARFLGLGRKAQLEVTLPEKLEKAEARDGVQNPPYSWKGEKSWWLAQMLGAIPPDTWCREWGVEPAQLIEAAAQSEWKECLLEGWSQAASRHRDIAWAEALLAAYAAKRPVGSVDELVAVLPPERQGTIVLQVLPLDKVGSMALDAPALRLADFVKGRWSPEFSRAMLERMRRHPRLRLSITEYARHMDPSAAAAVEALFPEKDDPQWRPLVKQALDLLQFRREMFEEIAHDSDSATTR